MMRCALRMSPLAAAGIDWIWTKLERHTDNSKCRQKLFTFTQPRPRAARITLPRLPAHSGVGGDVHVHTHSEGRKKYRALTASQRHYASSAGCALPHTTNPSACELGSATPQGRRRTGGRERRLAQGRAQSERACGHHSGGSSGCCACTMEYVRLMVEQTACTTTAG